MLEENLSNKYLSNNHWVYNCMYHLIFTTKYRRPVIHEAAAERIKEVVRSLQDDHFQLIEIEVMPDHVHILMQCDPESSLRYIVWNIKGKTSHALRTEFPEIKSRIPCLWTNSKFICTVGAVNEDVVKRYIQNQKKQTPGK